MPGPEILSVKGITIRIAHCPDTCSVCLSELCEGSTIRAGASEASQGPTGPLLYNFVLPLTFFWILRPRSLSLSLSAPLPLFLTLLKSSSCWPFLSRPDLLQVEARLAAHFASLHAAAQLCIFGALLQVHAALSFAAMMSLLGFISYMSTSQTCLLLCVVWVKCRVCHSTQRQPLLHLDILPAGTQPCPMMPVGFECFNGRFA